MDTHENRSVGKHSLEAGRITHRVLDLISGLLGTQRHADTIAETPVTVAAQANTVVDISTPEELRSLAHNAPRRLEQQMETLHDEETLREKQRIKSLLETHLKDSMWSELLSHVRPAAERGESEFLLIRFPSNLCNDGGRKIRVGEEGWPETLQGEAAELRDRWHRDLSQRGFGLAASTVEYRGGMPGDIGLFLTWHG